MFGFDLNSGGGAVPVQQSASSGASAGGTLSGGAKTIGGLVLGGNSNPQVNIVKWVTVAVVGTAVVILLLRR